jgi:cysteine desulfurase
MCCFGQRARAAIEKAREQAAQFLSCSASEIVFCSGATEANNLAIQGILQTGKPHVITLAIEHESVLAPLQHLEKQGVIEATYISVGEEGMVNPADVEKAMKENTALVSIQYANSEIGTIQPISEIAKIIKKYQIQDTKYKILFHADAVQAALYLECSVEKLGVDLLTLSSHKAYGPKGAGLLYIKKGVEMFPLLRGGGQEQDMRSGTENVAAIVGMGEALKEAQSPKNAVQKVKIRQLRDRMVKEVLVKIPRASLTGSPSERLPNNAHFLFQGVEGKDVVLLLNQKGIACSTGSACSERSQEPSHVVVALGYSFKEASSGVRFTLGKYTTREEIDKTVKALVGAIEQLRKKK